MPEIKNHFCLAEHRKVTNPLLAKQIQNISTTFKACSAFRLPKQIFQKSLLFLILSYHGQKVFESAYEGSSLKDFPSFLYFILGYIISKIYSSNTLLLSPVFLQRQSMHLKYPLMSGRKNNIIME